MLKITGAVLSAALIASFAAVPANAALSLYATDSGNPYNAVNVLSYFTGQGVYTFSDGAVLDFTSVDVSTQSTNPANLNLVSIDNITAKGVAGNTITLYLSGTDNMAPTGPTDLVSQLSETDSKLSGVQNGQANASLIGYEDNTNSDFATNNGLPLGFFGNSLNSDVNTTTKISVQGVVGGNTPTATATDGPFNFSAPYSLTEVLTITFVKAGEVSANFGAQLTPVATPEPASMLLFGTIAAGIAFAMRKRFQVNN